MSTRAASRNSSRPVGVLGHPPGRLRRHRAGTPLARPAVRPARATAPRKGRSPRGHGGCSGTATCWPYGLGHGPTYTSFTWSGLDAGDSAKPSVTTDGAVTPSFPVRNTGERAGDEVVQVYLHDPVASVVQPVQRLVGYVRVPLDPDEEARITVTVLADLASFTGRDGRRVVEPDDLGLRLAASSTDIRLAVTVTGPPRYVDDTRELHSRFRSPRTAVPTG